MVIVQKPGETTIMQVEFNNFQKYQTMQEDQIIPFLLTNPLIAFTARNCKIGEYYSDDYTCEKCPDNKNTYFEQTEIDKGKGCEECLEFAVCVDSATYPQEGFIRMTEDGYIFVKCFNEDACLEGTSENPFTNCEEGYRGVMCTSCDDFYWKDQGSFICYPCNSQSKGGALYIYILKVFVFAYFCYWMGLLLFRSFNQQNSESLATMRIWFTMFQMLAILNKMESTSTK